MASAAKIAIRSLSKTFRPRSGIAVEALRAIDLEIGADKPRRKRVGKRGGAS